MYLTPGADIEILFIGKIQCGSLVIGQSKNTI